MFLRPSGMFVFWTLQTVCFALYSERGDIKAAHTFIAMICKSWRSTFNHGSLTDVYLIFHRVKLM